MKYINLILRRVSCYTSIAGVITLLSVFTISCSEDRVGQNPTNKTSPQAVTNVQTESLPGGAKISYDLPNETDISYVMCEYMFKGEKMVARSSIYNNYVIVEGLGDIEPCEYTIYLVDHSENRSQPYTDSFIPLEPPYQSVFKTIEMEPDFGGVVIRWKNESKTMMGAFLLAMGDNGEWEEYDLVYSVAESEKRSIRGYNTDERLFAVTLVDQYGNASDTLKIPANPLYEKELDKKKFKDGHLLGDNISVNGNRPLSNIWDGNLNVIWHTNATAGYTPPQYFTIDFGVHAKLSRFILWNRPDFSYGQHNPRLFEVWGTDKLDYGINDEHWTSSSWQDGWVQLGDFEVVKPSGLPLGQVTEEDKAAERAGFEFVFESGVGEVRYVRFVVKETWAKTAALHINEVSFFGDDGVNEKE